MNEGTDDTSRTIKAIKSLPEGFQAEVKVHRRGNLEQARPQGIKRAWRCISALRASGEYVGRDPWEKVCDGYKSCQS